MPAFMLSSTRSVYRALAFTIGIAWSGFCLAQAVTTIGSSDAERCFDETRILPNAGDVEICTKALQNKGLNIHDRAATYSNRGILYAAGKEYNKALADHNKAIELLPTLGQAYINRGNVYFHLEDYDKALADYNKAIELKALPPETGWFNKGLTLVRLKRLDEAKAAFQEALKLAPNSVVIKNQLDSLRGP